MKRKIFAITVLFFLIISIFGVGVQETNADFDFSDALQVARGWWRRLLNKKVPDASITQEFPMQFGGRVLVALPCLCNQSYAFVIAPVSGPSGIYSAHISSLKQYYAPFPGNSVTGTANPGGVCSIWVPPYCVNISTNYKVTLPPDSGMGTSLIPFP